MSEKNEQILETVIVLRNDTKDNWEAVKNTATLRVGEIGIESDTGLFKIGKSKLVDNKEVLCTWAELEYANDIPEVDLSTVTNSVQVVDGTVADLTAGTVVGDMAIVRSVISGNTKSHTAYVWNGSAWAAMDGNYNASNVYYDKNIQVTQSVGNVTTSNNAPVDLEFAGKNMEQVWQYLYATEDLDLTIIQPSYSLSVSKTSFEGELGATFSDPTYSVSFSDGSYEYGSKDANNTVYTNAQKAGVVWETTTVTGTADKDTNGQYTTTTLYTQTGNTASGNKTYSIPDKVAKSTTDTTKVNRYTSAERKYYINSTSSCPASVRKPVTNLGNFIDATGKATTEFANGTKQTAVILTTDNAGKKSQTITVKAGWRGCFWGYKTSKALDPNNLTSADIRGLSSASKTLSATITQDLTNMQQIFIAAPKGTYSTVTVTNTNLGAPQTVKKVTDVQVCDATGVTNAIDYDVFYVSNDNPDSKTYTYKITVA